MMYAPVFPDVAFQLGSADPSDFERIELMNVGNEVVRPTNVSFEAGFDFYLLEDLLRLRLRGRGC